MRFYLAIPEFWCVLHLMAKIGGGCTAAADVTFRPFELCCRGLLELLAILFIWMCLADSLLDEKRVVEELLLTVVRVLPSRCPADRAPDSG